jgi:glutamate/tyrosine decarboxylase-like PLP-dependent enzyme
MSDELTLDPDDWSHFRRLAHRMVDDMIDHLSTLADQPAWQPMPDEVEARLEEPVPYQGLGEEEAYRSFLRDVLPYPNGNLHPRFFGWVQGNGTPLGMMADMLASGMNPHLAGFNHAPARVERQVIRWFVELMGFPAQASGLLVLGGSMASLLGIAVARHARGGPDLRGEGVRAGPRLMFYASSETHGWLDKSLDLMGLGQRSLRTIPADRDFRIDVAALRAAIAEDRAGGLRPCCVIGNAGTVGTGACDDLRALAALCREEGLWLHVDGAFGALTRLSDRLRHVVDGIELADSIAFDLHKWMYQPFDVACVLVRDGELHRAAFARTAPYLAVLERGTIAGGLPFADLGIDLSRGFRALKVWMSLRAYGVDKFARLIEQNVRQATALAEQVRATPDLELLAPVPLNIVCFRYAPRAVPAHRLDELNQEILLRLQETGTAVPSSTLIGGAFAIRCAIVNHRTKLADIERLVRAVVLLGREAQERLGAASPAQS